MPGRRGSDPGVYDLLYLIFIGLLFLESNGLLWELFQIGIHLGQVLVLIFISLTFFWGNLFAKKPIYDIIRKNSSLNANEILNAMLESLKHFQKGAKIEDDITLVVIKIKD